MTTVFWGAGAIGGLAAAYAARGGEDVLAVDVNEAHVNAINAVGLRVVGIDDFQVPIRAALPGQVQGPLDLVVLSVKSQHTLQALDQLEPLLADWAVVVSLQNGLNPPILANRLGSARTVGALMGYAGDYIEPGLVRIGSYRRTYVGRLEPGAGDDERLERVRQVFEHLCPTVITDNIMGYIWSKLCYCSLTTSTALTDEPVAEMLASSLGRQVVYALLAEAVRASEALGVQLEPFELFDPGKFSASAKEEDGYAFIAGLAETYRRGQKPHSGMWRDIVVHRRRSETAYLTGALIDQARQAGVDVRLNTLLVRQIAEIEDGTRSRGLHNLQQLADLISRGHPPAERSKTM